MVDYFGFDLDENGTALSGNDLTSGEIASSIFPALVGMGFLSLIAVMMLPHRILLWLSDLSRLASGIPGSDYEPKALITIEDAPHVGGLATARTLKSI